MNKLILTIVSLAIFLNKNCVDSFKVNLKKIVIKKKIFNHSFKKIADTSKRKRC